MAAITSYDEWIAEMTSLVSGTDDPEKRVVGALNITDRVLQGVSSLDLSRFVPGKTSYARHLIHVDPEDRFVLLCLVWKPGQGTPIHDHPSWGVYGVLKNRIRFVNYLHEESKPEPLTLIGEAIATAGSAVTVFPPINDVHRMENPSSDEISMTFHCYGQEVKEFNIYQRNGERRPGTVSYDTYPEQSPTG